MEAKPTNYFKQSLMMALMVIPLISIGQKRYNLSEFKLTISGTSTIHDWVIDAEKLTCSTLLDYTESRELSMGSFLVTIPVESLESGKGIMNSKTYEALKSEDYPNVTFKLLSLDSQTANSLKATGNLTIAGKTQSVQLDVTVSKSAGSIIFKGEKELLMTSFSVQPPSALMGTIKTDDLVKVKFEIQLYQHNNS
ncbi:MAG: YceI family protein [Bacteroidetes bacterium]|nr:YceI family protein [Bacteroidota bacterium]MDA1121228.1 YceI family protein [Bacteroidota bacterium]